MLPFRVFFCLLVSVFVAFVFCGLYLWINKNKLLKTLNDLGLQDLSKNLEKAFIPIRGSAEIKETNETWRAIKTIMATDIFLKNIQFVLKIIDCIKVVVIFLVGVLILISAIYLILFFVR